MGEEASEGMEGVVETVEVMVVIRAGGGVGVGMPEVEAIILSSAMRAVVTDM